MIWVKAWGGGQTAEITLTVLDLDRYGTNTIGYW